MDYDAIKQMKAAISIPVIANGDIKDYEKAKEAFERAECLNGAQLIDRGDPELVNICEVLEGEKITDISDEVITL